MQQGHSKVVEPANIVKKGQEPDWERAKDAAAKTFGKKPDQLADDDYALVTYLFKKFTGQETTESDTQSAFTQFARAGVKKESLKKPISIGFRPNLLEAQKNVKGSRFEIVLIEEGLGNLKDAFYYSPQAIQSAVNIFEGSAIYANHPSKTEEYDQPERTVEKKIGHIENVKAIKSDDNRMLCVGEAVILEGDAYDWVRTLLTHSLKYKEKHKGKEFIGFSINASGDSIEEDASTVLESAPHSAQAKIQEAINLGNEKIRVVTEITECVSCDLVTQAGAGGRVLKILEEDKMSKQKTKQKEADGEEQKPPHADEEQDKALIADMIKKHIGDKELGQEEAGTVHSNVEAYMETGMEKEEAVKHAVAEYKKECIKKEKAAQAESQETQEKEPSVEKKETQEAGEKPPVKESKESNETNLKETETSIKLTARVAMLESELKKERLEKYIDRKLAESGLPRAATKKFSEMCKGEFASEKDFDLKFKIFTEAYKETASVDYVTSTDKGHGGETSGSFSLADCVND